MDMNSERRAKIASIDWPALLQREYIDEGKTFAELERQYGIPWYTFSYYVRKYGFPRRTHQEWVRLGLGQQCKITDEGISILEGELLGDGCISWKTPGFSAFYQHTSKYFDYIKWLFDILGAAGIDCGGNIIRREREWGVTYYRRSLTYTTLAPIRGRFYPHGVKIVPPDMALDRIRARHWYLGDGCLAHPKARKSPHIQFSTDGFDDNSREILASLLAAAGFRPRLYGLRIQLGPKDVRGFLDWIGPCPAEIDHIYGYKWQV